jgi:hypothetical protein
MTLTTFVSLAGLPGEPIRNGGEKDQSLGGIGIDRPRKHDQPFPESLLSESLGFGFGRKCSGFAVAALVLRQLTTFAGFKGYIPSNVHCGTELNHGGTMVGPALLTNVQPRLD